MSTDPRQTVTLDEYLELEATAEIRHEFVNGEMVAMAGVSKEHSVIREALSFAVQAALRAAGKRCLTFSADTRLRIAETGLYAYPDMTVVCGKPEFDTRAKPESLLNPLVIFEVLSDSTEAYDRGAKFAHYKSRGSLQEYVLVATSERSIDVLHRGESGWWQHNVFKGDSSIPLQSLGIEIPLYAIYGQLDLL